MLPKRQRLSRREFETLLTRGRRVHGAEVSLVVLQAPTFKGGVMVSKKTARQATARNRIRRRVYALLSDYQSELAGHHVAVLTRPSAAPLSYRALRAALATLLSRGT